PPPTGDVVFNVTLTPSMDVPPCGMAPAGAAGSANITFRSDKTVVVSSFTFGGLSGGAIAAHIHLAGGPGQAGQPVLLSDAAAEPDRPHVHGRRLPADDRGRDLRGFPGGGAHGRAGLR